MPTQSLKEQLEALISGDVEDDAESLQRHSRDASIFEMQPLIVVYPKDSEDLKRLVNFVNQHKTKGYSLTPWSGGTDMSGGPLTDSIQVDFSRYFNQIGQIKNQTAVTQPGVYYRDFERATLQQGLLMPGYPASRAICTVGGMVANNSSGEKSLTYGSAGRYVKSLNVILRDGKSYQLHPLTKHELDLKMKSHTVEGQIYRRLYRLIGDNYETIQAARPTVSKNSTGYFLWDVWDGTHFDLTRLFVGSQGTLGLINEITFQLIKPKQYSQMVVIFLRDLTDLARVVNHVLPFKSESFETYDDQTLKLAVRFMPEMVKAAKAKSLFRLLWQFLPDFQNLLTGGLPKLTLLAEFTGDSLADVRKQARAAQSSLAELGVSSFLTKTQAESKKYWAVRRESFNLLRHHITDKHSAPFIDDIIVNPQHLPDFLPELNRIMSSYKLVYTLAGHIGNGNFHIFPLMDLADPKVRDIIPELAEKVFQLVFKYGGSMSGEHNDGLVRAPYLRQMYGDSVYRLFKEVKYIFDPDNIFNPHKKVNVSLAYTNERIRKS